MAFNDNKSAGDLIKSQDWDDFVDFAELISSNSYGHSSNTSIHLTSIQKTDLTDSGDTSLHIHDSRYYTETELNAGQLDSRYYTESEVDAISGAIISHVEANFQPSGVTSSFLDDFYASSLGSALSGSYSTHRQDSTIHFTKSSIDDDYAGSSQIRTYINTISGALDTKIDTKLDSTAASGAFYPSSLGKGVSGAVNTLTLWYDASASKLSNLANSGNEYSDAYNWFVESSSKLSESSFNSDNYITSANAIERFADSSNIISKYYPSTLGASHAYLSSLKDVAHMGSKSDGDVLTWDTTQSKWSSQAAQAAGISGWQSFTAADGSVSGFTGSYAVSGDGALSISVPGYTTISSQAKNVYDWFVESSSKISEYLHSGEEYTSVYNWYTASSQKLSEFYQSGDEYTRAFLSAQALREPAFVTWGRTSITVASGSHNHALSGLSDITLRDDFGTNRWKGSGLKWNTGGYWEPGQMVGGGDAVDHYTVKVDTGADDDYIGATASDGILRTNATIDYTDGGDFVTLNVNQRISGGAVSGSLAKAYTDTISGNLLSKYYPSAFGKSLMDFSSNTNLVKSGYASLSDVETIAHGLSGIPTYANASPSGFSVNFGTTCKVDDTNITIYMTAGGTRDVFWTASL